MSRTLITGASGFIGGHLAEALVRRDTEVRCLVRRTSVVSRLEQLGVELVQLDLAQPDQLASAVSGVDVVYHLAGKTSALRKSELMQVNGEGTGRLAAACASLRLHGSQPVLLYAAPSLAASHSSPRLGVNRCFVACGCCSS